MRAQGNCGPLLEEYPVAVYADNVHWKLYGDGTLIIWGHGDMFSCPGEDVNYGLVGEEYSFYASPWWAYDGVKIKKVEIAEGVTSIGCYAFARNGYYENDHSELKTVEIPASVSNIYEGAFAPSKQAVFAVLGGSYAEKYAKEHNYTVKVVSTTEQAAVNLASAKNIYIHNCISEGQMVEADEYDEYESYEISQAQETQWRQEHFDGLLDALSVKKLPDDQDDYNGILHRIGGLNRWMTKEQILRLLTIVDNVDQVYFRILGYEKVGGCLVQNINKTQYRSAEENIWILESCRYIKDQYLQIKKEIEATDPNDKFGYHTMISRDISGIELRIEQLEELCADALN